MIVSITLESQVFRSFRANLIPHKITQNWLIFRVICESSVLDDADARMMGGDASRR